MEESGYCEPEQEMFFLHISGRWNLRQRLEISIFRAPNLVITIEIFLAGGMGEF